MKDSIIKCLIPGILQMVPVWWLLILAVSIQPAFACSCVKISNLEEELEEADIVFAGRVIALMEGKVKFMVSQVWRGSIPPIIMARNLTGCMASFREGEEYLVFASDVREAETIERLGYQFVPSQCGQTHPIKVSQANLALLGSSFPPRSFTPEESELKEESLKKEIALLLIGGALIGAFLYLLVRKFRKSRYA